MKKLGVFQLVGPLALFVALAAEEGVAYALERAPSSEWLWYLNLRCFGMFQQSHYALATFAGGDQGQLTWIGLPLMIAAAVGLVFKRSLLLALSSNLSFVYILFVALAWKLPTLSVEASLSSQFSVGVNPELIVLASLVGLSLFSFGASHFAYARRSGL